MLHFIIRLDDACPNFRKENWDRIGKILDKHDIKPIVGIIPDSRDQEFIKYGVCNDFWKNYALNWQNKGWIIAQHGLHHNLTKTVRTEYKGLPYNEQIKNIKDGYDILIKNGINPKCFFAPAHTFDGNTIKACLELGYFKFISDGVSLYPYRYNDMLFIPSVFDTPHKILNNGVFTFVYHPNNMNADDFDYLENFLDENIYYFKNININDLCNIYKNRKRSTFDKLLNISIIMFRKFRKVKTVIEKDLNN